MALLALSREISVRGTYGHLKVRADVILLGVEGGTQEKVSKLPERINKIVYFG